MKNLIVGQSGGPTAVINSSLFGVIKEGLQHKDEINHVYGMINGIEGFLKDHYCDLETDISQESLQALRITPGAYLGSCRYKLPDDLDDPVYGELFKKFKTLKIGYFLYIGGNDSMDTVSKLSRYAGKHKSTIRIIGIPKTIDNDLVHTDHTPGFGSAAKYVASSVCEIGIDASVYDAKSLTIVEIMGRHAGWLTAASALARKFKEDNPVLIYLPETSFDQETFLNDLEIAFLQKKNLVVCISEGIHDKSGKFICEYASQVETDNFGHKMLTGSGKYLETLVKERMEIKVRSIELNVNQRCSIFTQSLTDAREATTAGSYGVTSAIGGATGKMVAFTRGTGSSYDLSCTLVDVNDVCNKEKTVPLEWITKEGTDVSQEFLDYVQPLIQGSPAIMMKNGLPDYAYRN